MIGKDLGAGVVVYDDAFNIDWGWMREYCTTVLKRERDAMYTPGPDPITGEMGYINKSGYFFSTNSIDVMPWRGSAIHQDTDPEVIQTLNYIEEQRDKCLLDYLRKYPIAGTCIWWKIKSHIVAYPTGSYLGMHADIATAYEYGKPHPTDQIATRNTVSVVAYLNDCVDTEDELDGTNFMGGHHHFEYLGITHKPKRGQILFFPSNYVAAHEVQPITAGWRYSYLGWYCQGTPNSAVRESVTDPIEQPEAALRSTNVYMTHGYKL